MSQDNLSREAEMREESSMDHWYPRLSSVDVPTPATETVEMHEQVIEDSSEAEGGFTVKQPDTADVMDAIDAVGGPPAFIRTDQASAKHRMGRASRIPLKGYDEETVGQHVWQVVEFNEMAGLVGLPYETMYVREWLNLWHEYEAFTGTPIAAEVRMFLHEGDLHDYGFYWPEEAIQKPDADDWREKHERTREMAMEAYRLKAAKKYAERVGEEFDTGYWSVDFALTEGDQWYCLDMARGEVSWHPDECEWPDEVTDSG